MKPDVSADVWKSGDEMEREHSRTKKTVVIFVLCALMLQGIFCLFFTTDALEKTFPLYVRAAAQDVTVGDNSYTEYFRLRSEAVNSDIIVVGIDFTSPQTFDLLADMIVSLKHDANIGGVIIDAFGDAESSACAAEVISSIMPDAAGFACDVLRENYEVAAAYENFLDRMNTINLEYPEARRMFGVAIENGEDHTAALLAAAQTAFRESRRPVLLLTDACRLTAEDPFMAEAECSGCRCLFIHCCYTDGVWDGVFPADRPAAYLVQREDLHLFDNLYRMASTFSDGKERIYSYSEAFSTEMFFVITDGVSEEANP